MYSKLFELMSRCHKQSFNMGWWSDCPTEQNRPEFRWYITTKLCLIHSEISEALDNGQDAHLPGRVAREVELADAAIRAMDLIGFLNSKGIEPVQLFGYEKFTDQGYPSWLLRCHGITSLAMERFRKGRFRDSVYELTRLVWCIEMCGHAMGYDIHAAAIEKLDYNLNRTDHQLVNRQAADGKSF